MAKKSDSTSKKVNRLTKLFVWIMLLAMVGGTLISALYAFFVNL